jgi:RsiW-degrading membrane proteinase PrsW (M82 family)
MLEENNILLFLFSVLPALLYSFFIYKSIPADNVKFRAAIGYLVIGLLAPTFVTVVQFIFPNWDSYIQYDCTKLYFNELTKKYFLIPTVFALAFNAFIQTGLLEESVKWISGHFMNLVRGSWVKRDSAIAVMFYYCMVATGFAITENIEYAQHAVVRHTNNPSSLNPTDVIFIRSASAIILHMICGLFMGYFIALGRQFQGLKKISYTILGLFVALMVHGAYDFNISTATENDYFTLGSYSVYFHIQNTQLIVISLILTFFMGNHLRRIKYKEIPKLSSNN